MMMMAGRMKDAPASEAIAVDETAEKLTSYDYEVLQSRYPWANISEFGVGKTFTMLQGVQAARRKQARRSTLGRHFSLSLPQLVAPTFARSVCQLGRAGLQSPWPSWTSKSSSFLSGSRPRVAR
jgi:hypothetical protein